MSTVENQSAHPWSKIATETLDPKYEKCRNIAEEIYKRINITFQIKKLEASTQSDVSDLSDQIDSNELSNETDLFACDKSSLSSTDVEQCERGAAACEKYININNNEEQLKKTVSAGRRPRKRFRKRIKKTQKHQSRNSDGSSDEGPPLSLVADTGRPPRVPKLLLLTADLSKLKTPTPEKKPAKKPETNPKPKPEIKKPPQVTGDLLPIIPIVPIDFSQKTQGEQKLEKNQKLEKMEKCEKMEKEKNAIGDEFNGHKCSICSLPFRSERGLRRHTTLTHQAEQTDKKKSEQRGKPA